MRAAFLAPLLLVLVAGCDQPAPAPTAAPAAPAASRAASRPAAAKAGLHGSVLETLESGGYTYLRLKTADGEAWAAVSSAPVTVGAEVEIVDALPMTNFESPTLKRTFEKIYFGSLGTGASASAMPAMPTAAIPASPTAAAPTEPVGKAEGADARTVAEVFAQKAALVDKPVSVRARVVKVTSGVMGRNWLHVRDGTGSAGGHDDDLTVTTKDTVAVGDTVLIRGTVHTDRDFGAGYSYPVIVEDASVTK